MPRPNMPRPPPARMPPPPAPAIAHRPTAAQASGSTWTSIVHQIRAYLGTLVFRECPLLERLSPRCLRPDFAWPHRGLQAAECSQSLPDVPRLAATRWRGWTGRFHSLLCWFSELYCTWYGFEYSSSIAPLPLGLVLKWADGTSVDEAQSMIAIRAAGFPCPRVISVGHHRGSTSSSTPPVSILMTRVPGAQLDEVYHGLSQAERGMIVDEIKQMLDRMRAWENPWGQRICSISGGSIRSIRVPGHRVGPCESETEFNSHLLSGASSHSFKSGEEFHAALELARKLGDIRHRVVFTHGDFALHNILVYEGHVSGFIDWECAGWYPEYWEFTSPLRWPARDPEGGAFFRMLGGEHYESELEAEMALKALTVDSWISI